MIEVEKNLFQEAEKPPQKKVKKDKIPKKKQIEEEEEIPRSISVLTDIFISLMTRPPHFLRATIHTLYESVIPELN